MCNFSNFLVFYNFSASHAVVSEVSGPLVPIASVPLPFDKSESRAEAPAPSSSPEKTTESLSETMSEPSREEKG